MVSQARPPSFKNRNMRTGVRVQPLPGGEHLLSKVGPGWEVYSKERRWAHNDEPVGGIVLDVETRTVADPDTGEIVDWVRYLTFDPHVAEHLAAQWVNHADVNPESITPPSRQRVGPLVRRWHRQLGAGRGWFNPDEVDRARYAHRLLQVIT